MTSPPANAADKPDRPKRPWYRPHRSTYLVLALAAVPLAILTVPGRLKSLGTTATYEHGWPCVYLVRDEPGRQGWPADNCPFEVAPWRMRESWRLVPCAQGTAAFHVGWLVLDLLVALAILLLVGACFEWWRRRRLRAWQFSLREMFVLTFAVALVGSWYQTNKQRADREARNCTAIDMALADPRNASHSHGWPEYCGPEWLARLAGRECLGFLKRPTTLRFWPGERLDRVRANIHELQSLKEVRIIDCAVVDADLREFAALPDLRKFTAHWAKLDGSRLSALPRLKHLRELNLALTDVTDDDLLQIARLDGLRKLNLAYTRVTARGLGLLRSMKCLEELTITGADDESLEVIAGAKSLKTLRILDAPAYGASVLYSCSRLSGVEIRYENLSRATLEKWKDTLPIMCDW